MAADQERLLRALVSGVSAPHADVALDGDAVGGDVDLRLLLARFADGAVHIVPPAEPVLTAPGVADELEAARGRARQRPPACR